MSHRFPHVPTLASRRDFLTSVGGGFGALALSALAAAESSPATHTAADPLAPKKPHFEAKAKSVIFLFMEGGPSHVDLFDPKPELTKQHGKPLPASFGKVLTPMGTGGNNLLASKRKFAKHGKSGLDVSDWLPHMAKCADDLTVLRACWADGLNHVGSVCQMNTGSILAGRPSLGSWALYGLGSENRNLPGFVVFTEGGPEPLGGARNYGTGYMPATYQGTLFRNGPNPILNLNPPAGVGGERQKDKLALIGELNTIHRRERASDTELAARQAAYELAFRMQASAPDAVDLSKESEKTKEMYGLNRKETAEFGHRCLLARRLVERGVRFVQVYCGAGSQWDAHSDIEGNHTKMCSRSDQPSAALIRDLKQRGMLDDTLVIWGGEFGRTPMSEGASGRDHNPYGFSMVMAGGGVKGGCVHGTTDEFGLYGIDGRVHVHDFHATILHLLGFDHTKLTFFHNGKDERLTDVKGKLIQEILV
ncbi:protein containing duf1501 : Uncharacterized protein OS=Planctomyces brasiliensis (strain ATCC 49424 / DSM 5305 / JCM 21570 / NBRC 103401 / IFAM 1448) GN=Plabr_0140 PE=4 SV=1: DUF1501 [Gemmata massiliana]|uniref:Uncharacterized protein n=1 Tax=Gemmata massiliana TaxID=1210884 RepID=A0A6P2D8P0_9BACT|nr:DUF1501 domain-containing protein [Gemmata massiliana]VTR97217.1 protein containing duf1501 : Uncharacterized protein OS=Planctomyces brasiliensis (strain ATCC 49424 / DSM 5305 / JCM 21570 / NBRC 103401 / IFAM 1448) GN=Plabr_0140 PE=4 SV=1: DUF1501 [Gemmata massiliana]